MVLSVTMTTEQSAAFAQAPGRPAASLTTRLRRGERAALAELYDLHAPRAYAVAMRVLGDAAMAEDIVHDAFIWLWEHRDRLDLEKGPPEALLLTVAHRRAIDAQRRLSRRRVRENGNSAIDPVDEAALATIAAIDRQDLVKAVRDSLANLSPEQRDALELAYFGGMTQADIAERQQVPVGTVKSRMRLALGHLRERIGGSHADV